MPAATSADRRRQVEEFVASEIEPIRRRYPNRRAADDDSLVRWHAELAHGRTASIKYQRPKIGPGQTEGLALASLA